MPQFLSQAQGGPLGRQCGGHAAARGARRLAQFDRGQISGVVKDATGGVVPGVTVTATNLQTQTARTTVTDGTGFYTFPNLPAGPLQRQRRSCRASRRRVQSNVQLDAAGSLSLDFTLETGSDHRSGHRHGRSDAAADRRRRCGRRSRRRTSSSCRSTAATRSAWPA